MAARIMPGFDSGIAVFFAVLLEPFDKGIMPGIVSQQRWVVENPQLTFLILFEFRTIALTASMRSFSARTTIRIFQCIGRGSRS